MDKIRLSLSGGSTFGDFARLYNWSGGFCDKTERISFPGAQSLMLFLISVSEYALTVEGDATLTRDTTVGDEFMRFYNAEWTEESKARGTGRATIKMAHPDHADKPYVFELSMGEFSHDFDPASVPEDDQGLDPRHDQGALAMMMQEAAHAHMGDLVGLVSYSTSFRNAFWNS